MQRIFCLIDLLYYHRRAFTLASYAGRAHKLARAAALGTCLTGDEEMRKRNIEIKLMLNEGEYERLTQKVQQSGMNRSAFLRRLIKGQMIYPIVPLLQLNLQIDSCLKQLRGIAVNINQIARYANTYHGLPELSYLNKMAQATREMQNTIGPVFSVLREVLYGDS